MNVDAMNTTTPANDAIVSPPESLKRPKPARKGKNGGRSAKKPSPGGIRGDTARPGVKTAKAVRSGSKTAQVLVLMGQKEGATPGAIMRMTGWQSHTVRGFISGTLTKKLGLKVESFRSEAGERTYRISN